MPASRRPRRPVFHIPRASARDQLHAKVGAAHVQKPEPLPEPRGKPPYRLDLAEILGTAAVAKIEDAGRLVLHTVGDTGGVKHPESQDNVALAMEEQFTTLNPAPSLFYHLGDVVYYYGQRGHYFDQFYDPYMHYPAPIFAIPGNHDGAVVYKKKAEEEKELPETVSLEGFTTNFCAAPNTHTPEAGESPRLAMTLPNVYWTLTTPFATIVGLYTNVPDHGWVDADQEKWVASEVAAADPKKALILATHHPVYSADAMHGSSPNIGKVLDDAFAKAGRAADLVLNAHVHNYQRFVREYKGKPLTYVVAGDGGYYHLHQLGNVNGQPPPPHWNDSELGVTLESYNQLDHGFLTLTVSKEAIEGAHSAVRKPGSPGGASAVTVDDRFTIAL